MKYLKQNKWLFVLQIAITLTGCSKMDILSEDGGSPRYSLALAVTDGGYSSADSAETETRVADNGYKTIFTAGDKIGLYAVRNNQIITGYDNLCLTLTDMGGGKLVWSPPAGSTCYNEGRNTDYYAYYPYQPTLGNTFALNPQAKDVDGFFAGVTDKWEPESEQGTYAQYTASDLMVGHGVIENTGGTQTLSFSMTHKMALAIIHINPPATKYELTDVSGNRLLPDYLVPIPDTTFVDFSPYPVEAGVYRYLVKPNTSTLQHFGSITSITGKTWEYTFGHPVAASKYKIYKISVPQETIVHTLQVGDYYLNNGALIGKEVALTQVQKTACIGVVCRVQNITNFDPTLKADHPDCTHGVVVIPTTQRMKWTGNGNVCIYDWLVTNMPNQFQSIRDNNPAQGYNNTKAIEAFNAKNQKGSCAPVSAVVNYRKTVKAPTVCSDWYLPSSTELYYCYLSGIVVINNQLSKAGKTQISTIQGDRQLSHYWASAELNIDYAYFLGFNPIHTREADKTQYPRGICFTLAF